MTTRRLTAALVASVLLFGTAAGCASSDDSGSGDDTDTTEESTDETTDETTDEDTDDTTDEDTDDTSDSGDTTEDTDLGDLGDLGDVLGGECLEFAVAYASLGLAILGAADESAAEELSATLDELDASVPEEVQDDWEVVRGAYEDWAEAISENGILSDEATEASEALSEGDVAEAQANIDAYLEEACS